MWQTVYLATIWSGMNTNSEGFISILNQENQLISAPGGIKPVYKNEKLMQMSQSLKIFQHPHDVFVSIRMRIFMLLNGIQDIRILLNCCEYEMVFRFNFYAIFYRL